MELQCGGHKGGWMKIAELNTSRGDDCPSEWTKITNPIGACIAPNDNGGCYSTHYQKCGHRIVCSIRVFKMDFHVIKFSHCSLSLKY